MQCSVGHWYPNSCAKMIDFRILQATTVMTKSSDLKVYIRMLVQYM